MFNGKTQRNNAIVLITRISLPTSLIDLLVIVVAVVDSSTVQ